MRWFVAALVPAIPLLAGVLLQIGAAGAEGSDSLMLFLSSMFMLLVATGIFFFMVIKVVPACRYSGGYGLAILGTLLAVPVSLVLVFILMGVAVSLPDGVPAAGVALALTAQLVISAPLALGAYLGILLGNSKQLGQLLD